MFPIQAYDHIEFPDQYKSIVASFVFDRPRNGIPIDRHVGGNVTPYTSDMNIVLLLKQDSLSHNETYCSCCTLTCAHSGWQAEFRA